MTDAQESRVFVEWYGGGNYAMSYPWERLEAFDTVEAAQEALVSRYTDGDYYRQDFAYVNRDAESAVTPAVTMDSEMWVFYSLPTEDSEHYPDAVIHLRHTEQGGVEAYVEPA